MRLGEPDASGRRRPEPVPGSEFVVPRRHGRQGDRPAAARRSSAGSTGSSSTGGRRRRRRARPANPKFFAAGDAVNGGASVVEAVARGKRAARRSTRHCDERADRDPLARARRPGREDGVADTRAGAAARRARASRRSRSTGPSAAGRRCARYTRFGDRPIRRHDSVRAPDVVVVLEPSLAARGRVADGLGPDGLVLVNAERRRPSSPASTCAVSRRRGSPPSAARVREHRDARRASPPRSASRRSPSCRTRRSRLLGTQGRRPTRCARRVAEGYACLS